MNTNNIEFSKREPRYEEKITAILQDLIFHVIKQNPKNMVRKN